jgi:DNA (cytosine-5)-methyltransferase 1
MNKRRARRSKRGRELRAIDLFAGCGGLTAGLRAAGYSVIGAVESDLLAASSYRLNHPSVRLFRSDIRRLSVARVMRTLRILRGRLDLVAGCPPCQGFSTLTTHNGHRRVDDPRNGLIMDFLRFVRVLLPRAVMLENVPALAQDHLFAGFVTALERLGYAVKWDVLNVADFGVPQRRKRLVLIATRGVLPSLGAAARGRVRTVRDAIASLPRPGKSGDVLHDLPERRSSRVARVIARIPKDGGSRTDLPTRDQLPCHNRTSGFRDVYGRMAWGDVAPTITSGCFNPSKGRFLHPSQNRCITLREAALLQSFPRRYRFDLAAGKERIALMIGNAIPPRFVRWHALHLSSILEGAICSRG